MTITAIARPAPPSRPPAQPDSGAIECGFCTMTPEGPSGGSTGCGFCAKATQDRQESRPAAPNAGKRYPAQVLTPDEVTAIIGQCSAKARSGIRNRAMLTLLYRSGLRISEALALRPSDISLAAHSVRVLNGKGGKTTTRGFHPSADDALARWLDTRRRMGLRNGPLFCTLAGTGLHPQYVRNLLHRLGEQAGVGKRVHPHGLRHSFAFELEQAGTPVTVISKLLGHSSIAVTARYLDHLTNHQAVTALENVTLPPLGSTQ